MAPDGGRGVSSFLTQADALLRKNLTFQKRHFKENLSLVFFPAFLCLLMVGIQFVVNSQLNEPRFQCGCNSCVGTNTTTGSCHKKCGLEFSDHRQAAACSIPKPHEWPALIQIPAPQHRSVRTETRTFEDLPDISCMKNLSCPATSLFTGQNRSFAEGLVDWKHSNSFMENGEDTSHLALSVLYLGTDSRPGFTNFIENAFLSESPLGLILPMSSNLSFTVSVPIGDSKIQQEIRCVEGLYIWRGDSSSINKELFQGYYRGNQAKEIHEIVGAYDFLDSSVNKLNVTIWYNSSFDGSIGNNKHRLLRVPRPINMVSNAYLRYLELSERQVLLNFVKEMPTPGIRMAVNLSVMLGPLLYAWVIQLVLPVFLMSLVYEKQHNIRKMMKLHGLRDGPYWLVTYGYFLCMSTLYMVWFATFGSIIGLEIFLLNNYIIQFIFYFLYLNLQIALAFLANSMFSEVKTATVICYMYVFSSGLLGAFLFQPYIEDATFSRTRLLAMQLIPGFSLYRGLYDFSQYALAAHFEGTFGMTWKNLFDEYNGMRETLIIMALEWMILLYISYHLDQIFCSRNGEQRDSSFFSRKFHKGRRKGIQPCFLPSKIESSTINVHKDKYDICEEKHKVEQFLKQPNKNHPILCHNLEKVYIGIDGKMSKNAVRCLSLAVSQGECFGMLGPSGSGKTTIINMMTGFLPPTSGMAFINNMEVRTKVDQSQMRIGVCPQKDVLWETLTGREHLLFYGRLRNLKGDALEQAVEEFLQNLGLNKDSTGDTLAGHYSGGMKRRLSFAIALIGDTQVVFLDEPTAGLDPESKNDLWQVVKLAKIDRAIILTTHSMDEAEFLCDRLGIIVKGKLQCLGSPNELKTRYGRSYILVISANPIYKEEMEHMVASLLPNAVKIYDVAMTTKYRLTKENINIPEIFEALEYLKQYVPIFDFGLTTSSLEDVFMNVVDEAFEHQKKSFV